MFDSNRGSRTPANQAEPLQNAGDELRASLDSERHSHETNHSTAQDHVAVLLTMAVSAHDPLLARLVERVGFEMIGLSGNAVSASYLGLPDRGFLNLSDMANVARRIAAAVTIPVFPTPASSATRLCVPCVKRSTT